MKTENLAQVGKHAFEIAGLGKAPFRFIGASENVITYPDGTQKAGGSCDYCGTGIRTECLIVSADGKQSKVGCNCIEKVGDTGILKAYKSSAEYRTKQRAIRVAKDKAVTIELTALLELKKVELQQMPHPYGFKDRETGMPMTKWDHVIYSIGCCGAAGRKAWLKTLKAASRND